MRGKAPTRDAERNLWAAGHDVVVGVDEVGRGAWAGPLMVGAAVLPRGRAGRIPGIRDSKLLPELERERLFAPVAGWCTAWAVGSVSHVECDELGMAEAQREAARRAIAALGVRPDAAIVDGSWNFLARTVPTVEMRVKADATCLAVAAASILAKVTRDRVMRAESEHFPAFGFDSNKGYPCPVHRAALHGWGPSTIHRRSWVFLDGLCWPGLRRHRELQPTLF
jgi:ribonuclease HII